jgi:hypothetical protein
VEAAVSPWAYVLAVSLAANAALTYVYLGERDKTAIAETERDNARGAATACSDATKALRDLADKRDKEAKAARAAAAESAKGRDKRADQILSTPASSPDDCKAAQDRAAKWLGSRK